MTIPDSIRVSDADRDRVTAQLRDHFAAGRITPGELDERLSAALNAKTFGDLPPNAQAYVRRVEELSRCTVSAIGVGPGRDQTLVLRDLV